MSYPIIHIKWIDSTNIGAYWTPVAEVLGRGQTDCIIQSVGFLLEQTETTVTIARCLDLWAESTGSVAGAMQIPKVAIKGWKVLVNRE